MFRSGFARCPLDGSPLQELVDDPLAGTTFADRYIIERCIGEGGMGRVYLARHQRVSRKFAIKVLYGDHATDPKMRDRFAREAEAASRLDHPNVVSVVDFGETEEGLLYLVMDYVKGRELAEIIDEAGPLHEDRVERILRGLCNGLRHAHDRDLVHRDFKAQNVVITGTGDEEVARIVDFGIAVMMEASDLQRLTTEGMVLGTPAYMSPEQATASEMDHRTDLFSLGVLTYEMLAGVLPFEGPPLAVARQNLAVEPPPICERVPGLEVSPRLEAIAMRLMAKKPRNRFQSAKEVLDALDEPAPATARGATAATPPAIANADKAKLAHAATAQTRAQTPETTEQVAAFGQPRRRWPIVVALATIVGVGLFFRFAGTATNSTDSSRSGNADQVDASATRVTAAPPDAGTAVVTRADEPRPTRPSPAPIPPPQPAIDEPNRPTITKRGATTARTSTAKPVTRSPSPTPSAKPSTSSPTAPTPTPKAPAAITTRDLTSLYKSVGAAIERLADSGAGGAQAAVPLRARFGKLPFADALRTPSLRVDVRRQLLALQTRVRSELKKTHR